MSGPGPPAQSACHEEGRNAGGKQEALRGGPDDVQVPCGLVHPPASSGSSSVSVLGKACHGCGREAEHTNGPSDVLQIPFAQILEAIGQLSNTTNE